MGRHGRGFDLGYKLHISVDHRSILPLASVLAPANDNEKKHGPTLVEKTKMVLRRAGARLRSIIGDSQYSSGRVRGLVDEAVIPFMANQRRGEDVLRVDIRKMIRLQEERRFDYWCSGELNGKTLGILGVGNLGRPVAKTGKMGFDMAVIGWDKYVNSYQYVDRIFPENQLDEVLKSSDFLVITLPLTPETDGLIGERELKLMKQSAYLVNVARGDILVKDAFLKALGEKWIAGAAVDAFWGKDPVEWVLFPEDKIWEFENVLISPHTAWFSERYAARACKLFCDNLERYIKGEELINIVKER